MMYYKTQIKKVKQNRKFKMTKTSIFSQRNADSTRNYTAVPL